MIKAILIVTMLSGDIIAIPKANMTVCHQDRAALVQSQARIKDAVCVDITKSERV